ncbi:MAG: hypothetical protein SVX43_18275, partial [Cyanobacteriota bacterium]|nr:hypothetical protein [Cyanobacteriota bacterium]
MMQFETEAKTEAPSPEAKSPSLWTEETLGDLVGLGERSGEGEPNVMSPEELFEEDPRDRRSQRGFSESPWSKGGLVYGVVGVGFLMFGFLMTQIFNQSSSEQPQLEAQKPAEASVAFEEETNEEGRLKTQLALSEQAERMKEIEQERRPQTQLTLADLESGDSDSPPAPSPPSTEPSSPRVRSRPATPPVRTVPRSLSPPPSRSLPPRLPPPRDDSRPSNPV